MNGKSDAAFNDLNKVFTITSYKEGLTQKGNHIGPQVMVLWKINFHRLEVIENCFQRHPYLNSS